MNLSAIRRHLAELDLHPSKSLGQNFLADTNLARWIVDQLELTGEEHLVEIGPGLGALTEWALPRCRTAKLIEKDRRLAGLVQSRFESEQVRVLHQDALEFDARTLFPHQPVKLLGNLPYYVTSPILFQFTGEPSPVSRLVITIQREFADRLSAGPRTKDYGALTLIIGRRWRVKYLRTLPASVFFPRPKVDSGVLLLTPREPGELPDCDGRLFSTLVKQGFSQRRKQLRKLLAEVPMDWAAAVAGAGMSETARAEELTIEQWIQLTNLASTSAITQAQDLHGEMFDVVDENDRVTGRSSRHEAHTRKLKHRAVHVFVFNAAGDLFLQKRSRWKDVHPSKWDSSAAGHVSAGDDYQTTASREVIEELGATIPVLERIAKIAACEMTGWEFVELFCGRHEGPFALPPAEIETGGWFPPAVIDEWLARRPDDFASGFVECYRAFKESASS